jgi:hypothetical protein
MPHFPKVTKETQPGVDNDHSYYRFRQLTRYFGILFLTNFRGIVRTLCQIENSVENNAEQCGGNNKLCRQFAVSRQDAELAADAILNAGVATRLLNQRVAG